MKKTDLCLINVRYNGEKVVIKCIDEMMWKRRGKLRNPSKRGPYFISSESREHRKVN